MGFQIAPFNSLGAEFALVNLARDMRKSKPKDQDTIAQLCTPPPLHPLTLSAVSSFDRTDRQLLVFSISTEVQWPQPGPNPSKVNFPRQLVALSVPNNIAKQLFSLSVSSNPAQERSTSSIRTVTEVDSVRQLLEVSTWSDAFRHEPITSVFSNAEFVAAGKLLDLVASKNSITHHFAAVVFNKDDFLILHSLLDRFTFQKPQGPASLHFTPGEVAAAHQLRAFFGVDDPKRPIGPMFLAFRDDEESLRLVLLSNSKNAAHHLRTIAISREADLD
ncbi:hypothetical protein MMC22_011606 [Lobaria immixta]|nr:hypothetical protein [Lobaria immixta]